MLLTQNWVGYLDRSYQQVKQSVISRMVKNNPEITDHSESNPLILLISIFAGVAEMLNYYIDSIAREAYLGTAQKYTSVVKLVELIDYRIKARSVPTVDLLFTAVDNAGNLVQTPNPIFIPAGTQISDSTGLVFTVLKEAVITTGQSAVYATAAQYDTVTDDNLGTSDGSANQQFILPIDYVNNSLRVRIGLEEWLLFGSLGQMKSTTKGYIVDIEQDGNAYVKFGDGINGQIPPITQTILGNYQVTQGATANLPPNSLTQIISTLSIPTGITLTVNNPDYVVGGSDFESMEEIRNRAPRHIRTLDRAVTYQDYIDVTLQVPSVGAAEVSYCCGKYVDVYVVPKTRGSSTIALLDEVQAHLDARKMITTQVAVKASGISKVWLKVVVYGQPLYDANSVRIPVINALDDEFGFAKIQVNRKIAISDIIRVLENLIQVDRVEIQQVRVLPFPRPSDTTNTLLNIEFINLPASPTKWEYTLVYKAISDSFQVIKGTSLAGDVATGATYNDGIVQFKVNSGSYNDGNSWTFVVTPSYPEIFPSGTIDVSDFTAPIIDVGPVVDPNVPRTIFSDIQIVTQGIQSNTVPPCA